MKDFFETLQKLVPWAAGLPLAPKIAMTVIIVAVAVLFLMLIWSPTRQESISTQQKTLDHQSEKENARLKIVDLVVENASSLNPILDIKLLNTGTTTAFLTRLSANVLERVPYAGLVNPSASYDLLISSDRNEINISHDIPPNGTERIVVKLGAARHNLACYFRLQLELIYNGDKSILSDPFEVKFIEKH